MGTDAAWPLHKAISTVLEESTELRGFLGNPIRLSDGGSSDGYTPEAPMPRLAFGDSRSRAWQSATFDGQEHEITLHLWSPPDDADRSRQIAGVIINLLHDADLPVPGHALVDMQFESSETRYLAGTSRGNGQGDGAAMDGEKGNGAAADQGACHCLLTFKGLTVSD